MFVLVSTFLRKKKVIIKYKRLMTALMQSVADWHVSQMIGLISK